MAVSTFARRLPRALAASLAAALLAGCELSTADDTAPRLTFAIAVAEGTTGPDAPARIEIVGGQRNVQALGGIFVAPCLTANRDAQLNVTGGQLTIRVISTPNNAACSAGPAAAFAYNAYVTNLQPGSYTVKVVHEGDAQVATGTVVKERTVTVANF